MTVTTEHSTDIDAERLATLKQLALVAGFDGHTAVSAAELGDRLDLPTATARAHLRDLADSDHVTRAADGTDQHVHVTASGRRLLAREYDQYRRLFGERSGLAFEGVVEDGMGEGQHYISLPGYVEQFEQRLGYAPFPGTLNVRLDERSVRDRDRLATTASVAIDAWSDDERTYGSATCYPVVVEANGLTEGPAHVLVPDRTHHDPDLLEVIAPTKLRTSLELTDGSEVRLEVLE
jgi:riboflavin kinase